MEIFSYILFPTNNPNHSPQLNEGPHDGDVDLDGPLAVKDTGQHGDPLAKA